MYLSPIFMTPFTKKKDIKNNWYIINAQNLAVGRLAAYISKVLRGKNKWQVKSRLVLLLKNVICPML